MNETQTEIGVVIGRFQLHELHTEHIKLIEHVLACHEKVILFLGTTSAMNTQRNPLDFITRKAMIEATFGNRISSIVPLADCKSNEVWSDQIHTKVREIFPSGKVTLYGSKDSFIPYYKGNWKTTELEPEVYVSATDIRKKVAGRILASSDFRAGIIYSVYSQYPRSFSTVDVAIFNEKGEILLGQKPNEKEWRFVGGFVDVTDDSDEAAARREGREETGLELADFEFVCSKRVEDWRYKASPDAKIMTHLYKCKYTFGSPQPQDDIAALKWFPYNPELDKILVGEHKKLLVDLLKNTEK